MGGDRKMDPAEFLDRSIDRRVRFFGCDLAVVAGVFELKFVLQVVPGQLSEWLTKNGKAGKAFASSLLRKLKANSVFSSPT
jgi:hypothetical protein